MQAYLRRANKEDMDLLYQWANDPLVRVQSFSVSEINYEEHQKWFHELLEDPLCRQYIYVYNSEDIGQIRLTITGIEAEIGYSIQRDKRGMGHGKMILELLAEQVKKDNPEIKKLTAKVKPQNIASQKVFLDRGFVEKYQCYELEMDSVYLENGSTDVIYQG